MSNDKLRERLEGLADALDRRRYPENAALVREAAALIRRLAAVAPPATAVADAVTDKQCEAVYQAVSMANITRDVKTPERKREVVRAALAARTGKGE